jgi:ribosome-associated protein
MMAKFDLKEFIVKQLENGKVEDIISIDTSKISSLADCVIIGSGRSGKHIESTIENLKNSLKGEVEYNGLISNAEGSGWAVYDLGNIIIHLFTPEVRAVYKLEELFQSRSKNISAKNEKPKVKKPVVKKEIKKVILKKETKKIVKQKVTSKKNVKEK